MTQPRREHGPTRAHPADPPDTPQRHLAGTGGPSPEPAAATTPRALCRGGLDERDTEFLRKLRDVQRMFAGEWTSAILIILSDGPKQYTQIRDSIRSLSTVDAWSGRPRVLHESVLTRALKTLTDRELITREQISRGFPPLVIYALTPASADILVAWRPMVTWAQAHTDLITRAQQHHRHRRATGGC